jgi:hypothetical protein
MPRSFAWGPQTPIGTCAVGLINGRVAVTRLLPQVISMVAFSILLPPASPPVAASGRCLGRDAAQRAPPALCPLLGLELCAARRHRQRSR